MAKGRLEVITGPMASGKSDELIRRLTRATIARQQVRVFTPTADTRSKIDYISSRDNRNFPAVSIQDPAQILGLLKEKNAQVIGIEEIHFFDCKEIVVVVDRLVEKGYRVIVSGLDTDFLGEPFEATAFLLAKADEVIKLSAICVVCGKPAVRSQRLIDNKPASRQTPRILVGDILNNCKERYEPRCRDCHCIPEE